MTSEEIVRTLRKCVREDCADCSLNGDWRHCHDRLSIAAAELIERLEKEKAALVKYPKKLLECVQCAHYRPNCGCDYYYREVLCLKDCPCQSCKRGSNWEWKGVDKE